MAVIFDASKTQHGEVADTWNHTIGADSNSILLVSVGNNFEGYTATAITFNGVALTKLYDIIESYRLSQLWYLVNPDAGEHAIVVTKSVAPGFPAYLPCYISASFLGIDPAGPFRNTGNYSLDTNTPAFLTVEDCVSGDLVVGTLVENGNGVITDEAGQTSIEKCYSPGGNNGSAMSSKSA